MAHSSSYALSVKNLSVLYTQNKRQQRVLDNISFTLRKGELLAMLGESGSGKTTCGKALMGLLPSSARITSGTMQLGAEAKLDLSRRRNCWQNIRGNRIAMIYQDAQLALNPVKNIRSHFQETLSFHRMGTPEQIDAKSIEYLELMKFDDPQRVLDSYPFELSGGMCQRVYIALVLCLRPHVIIADEPTSALDVISQREVLVLIKEAQKHFGLSILFITHDIGVAHHVSDRIIVLEKGSVIEEGITKDVLLQPKHSYTRALIDARHFPANKRPIVPYKPENLLLRIKDVSKSYGEKGSTINVLNDLNIEIYRNESVGILGVSGCGKSTFAKCIVGLEKPDNGTICYKGHDITHLTGKKRNVVCQNIQMVFQDARASLNPRRTAVQLVQEPLLYLKKGSRKAFNQKSAYYLEQVGLELDAQNRKPQQLSTGQCQRVAIARALILEPEILICDEAVSALDMILQKQILELLHELQRKFEFSIVMISHDIRVLRHYCQRIAVMKNGNFHEVIETDMLTHEQVDTDYTRQLLSSEIDIEKAIGRE